MTDREHELAHRVHELELRLADVALILHNVERDDHDEAAIANPDALLSALDYAVRGSAGCIEPDEWERDRRVALHAHRTYLELP